MHSNRKLDIVETAVVGMKKQIRSTVNKKIIVNANKFNRQQSEKLAEGMSLTGKALMSQDAGISGNKIVTSKNHRNQRYDNEDLENEPRFHRFGSRTEDFEDPYQLDIAEIPNEKSELGNIQNEAPVNLNDSDFEENPL